MSERVTDAELAEIEARANAADVPRLVAEIRRVRGLFSGADAELLDAAGDDAADWARPYPAGSVEARAPYTDLACRIREAIGGGE